ncbi:hypothetical protein Bpfe_001431, partial [Biomphalaria pfeifferi]
PAKYPCVTSLLPMSAWKYQYDIYISQSFSSYNFLVQFIVPAAYRFNLTSNAKFTQTGLGIPGKPLGADTAFYGLQYALNNPVDKYYHFQLSNKVKPFAAYVFGTKGTSSFCHPLGFSYNAKQTSINFDKELFVEQLKAHDETTQPQVTCGMQETSTGFSVDNSSCTCDTAGNSASTVPTTIADTTGTTNSDTTSHIENTITTFVNDTTPDLSTDTNIQSNTPASTQSSIQTSQSNSGSTSESSIQSFLQSSTLNDTSTFDDLSSTTKTYTDLDFSDLVIEAKNTSAYRRTLISIPDTRVSAKVIGGFGIIIISSVFTFVSSGDLTYLKVIITKFMFKH